MIVIFGESDLASLIDKIAAPIIQQIEVLGELIVATAAENQAKIDAIAVVAEKVKTEVVALRQAYDAGQELDFSRVEAVLGELDSVNPDAPVEESPADGSGVTDEEAEEGSI